MTANKVCFDCGKEIIRREDGRMVGVDVPYINLFFHRTCLNRIGGLQAVNEYLSLNKEKLYNWVIKSNGKGKK